MILFLMFYLCVGPFLSALMPVDGTASCEVHPLKDGITTLFFVLAWPYFLFCFHTEQLS